MMSAVLFTWMQGADFYYDLHKQAVELLPNGSGKSWLDVGCGPGFVSRMAAEKGYQVTGIDSDAMTIQAARLIAGSQSLSINFKTGDIFNLQKESADIVSAASILAVLDDREGGLLSLWDAVRAGGSLLIIEPTDQMTPQNAEKLIRSGLPPKRIRGLSMWATARQGNIVDPDLLKIVGADSIQFVSLLQGLVGAWVLYKKA